MNTDLNEDKGLASSPDGRDVKLEIISEANANSLVSTPIRGELRHAKIVDSASALRAQDNSKGAFDLSAFEVGKIEFNWTRIGRGKKKWFPCCCSCIAENQCVESSTEASLNRRVDLSRVVRSSPS